MAKSLYDMRRNRKGKIYPRVKKNTPKNLPKGKKKNLPLACHLDEVRIFSAQHLKILICQYRWLK